MLKFLLSPIFHCHKIAATTILRTRTRFRRPKIRLHCRLIRIFFNSGKYRERQRPSLYGFLGVPQKMLKSRNLEMLCCCRFAVLQDSFNFSLSQYSQFKLIQHSLVDMGFASFYFYISRFNWMIFRMIRWKGKRPNILIRNLLKDDKNSWKKLLTLAWMSPVFSIYILILLFVSTASSKLNPACKGILQGI